MQKNIEEKYIVWNKEVGKDDLLIAGGKGANLGEMFRAGLPVPNFFIVTAKAYRDFLEKTGLKKEIAKIVEGLNVDDTKALQDASSKIQDMIREATMPEDIKREIVEAYRALGAGGPERYKALSVKLDILRMSREVPFVAVRSSATSEDLPSASFAGQQATFLNVKGESNVVEAVQKCWASLFTARAIFYRAKHGFDHMKVEIAVIVQKMVNSEKSGVAFSCDPVTGDLDKIVIEAGFGLGEAIVSGEINPDLYVVDKKDFKILRKEIREQRILRTRNPYTGENVTIVVPTDKMKVQKLKDSEIVELAKIVKSIEDYYQFPQDIEWAIEEDKIYVVQTRPVTTIEKVKKVEEKKPSEEELKGKEVLKGLPASPGFASGIVKIVHDPSELDKVKQGDVLVTKMTNPDYVPAMRRASAIVTDEGGLTCIAGDTLLLTNKGFVKAKELYERIKNGEELLVLGFDYKEFKPKWKKILRSMRRKSKVIRVSFSQSGRIEENFLDITHDHKLYILRNRELVKKELREVLKDGNSALSMRKINTFSKISSPKLAYLIGLLVSNSCVRLIRGVNRYRRGAIIFTQKTKGIHEEISQNFLEIFQALFGEHKVLVKNKVSNGLIQGEATDFIFNDLKIALLLNKLVQNIEEFLLNLDEESLIAFVCGLIDGDGSISQGRIQIYVGKENILRAVVTALLGLGILPQVTRNRNIFNVQITSKISIFKKYSVKVKNASIVGRKRVGYAFFSASDLLSDIVDQVNWGGKIKPYVVNKLLIDKSKIRERILPLIKDFDEKMKLEKLLNSPLQSVRVKFIGELGEIDVFNFEVDESEEMEKNYIVFTKRLMPILVSNCHAAIVSRELGIPCIVGTGEATQVLHEGELITVDATKGVVYKGVVEVSEKKAALAAPTISLEEAKELRTKTKIYMNLGVPEKIDDYKDLPFDGIGLMRVEFIIASYIGEHPNYLLEIGQEQKYIDKLAEGIAKVAKAIEPKPVVVRFSDFKTNEYRELKGGEKYEPPEANPMIGWRGVSRYISPEFEKAFRLECKAIKKVRDEMKLKNVWVMLPFVRTVWEVEKCLKILEEEGLKRSEDFKVWLMAEVPSIIFLADEFSKLCDGFSIGSNDLTQLILGADRDSGLLGRMGYFDERDPAVLRAMKHLIEVAHRFGKTVSICGQSVSVYPEITEFLVRCGIDSISVNPDAVVQARKIVYDSERKIQMEKMAEEFRI